MFDLAFVVIVGVMSFSVGVLVALAYAYHTANRSANAAEQRINQQKKEGK